MNDLEEDDAQESPDLRTYTHTRVVLLLEAHAKLDSSAQRTAYEEEVYQEEPQVCMMNAEVSKAIISRHLCDDLYDNKDRFEEWILEDRCIGCLE